MNSEPLQKEISEDDLTRARLVSRQGQLNLFTGEIEPLRGEAEQVAEERWLFDPDFRLVLPEDPSGKEILVEPGVSLNFPMGGAGRRLQQGKRGQGTGYREQGTGDREQVIGNREQERGDVGQTRDYRLQGTADAIQNPDEPLIFGKRPFVPAKPRVAKAEDLAQLIISGFGVYLGKRSERLQVKISGKVAKDENGSAYEFPFFRIREVVIASRGVSISSDLIEEFSERMLKPRPQAICDLLNQWFRDDPQKWPPLARNRIGDEDMSIVPLRLGLQGESGVIVAGSQRADFPGQTERLVLSVVANQAFIGLQEARLLRDQKRVASDLDQRVAQRTRELAEANEELKKEIAERRRAEEALRNREQSFRLIVDGIAGLVAIMTATGKVEVVNRQALDYFGKTVEELKRWSTIDAAHPDDLPGVVSAWKHSVETSSPYDVDHRLRRADGVYRWFHARGLPLRDAEGRILRWYVLLTDIDDRRRAEEALKRSEAFLAEGQRLSSVGSFSWRVATDEITWSEQLHRIFDFDPGVPVTLALIGTRVHPEDLPLLNDLIEGARAAVSDFEYEHRLVMPDHSIKYVHLIAHGTRDKDGQLEYIGAVQDVTQRRSSEEALARAWAELAHVASITSLGVLTASIAHEVSQPLSGIITNASTCLRMLAADRPNIDGARETARRTIRDGNRASEVVTRLRALFSKKGVPAESVDLNEAAREVIALSLSELQTSRVILRSEFADDLPFITGDRVQLQQVILNLLRNASDAMTAVEDRPRQLLIRTERDEGDRVRLTVEDAGIGFDPQAMDRLFEAFYTTKNDGMGIGLSVSRSIIENHHGRLWATPNDGPGATFSFSIPCGPEGVMDA